MRARTKREWVHERAEIRRDIRRLNRERKRTIKAMAAERAHYEAEQKKRVSQRINELVAVYREILTGKAGFALTDPRMSVCIAAADERARVGLEAYRALIGRLVIAVQEGK